MNQGLILTASGDDFDGKRKTYIIKIIIIGEKEVPEHSSGAFRLKKALHVPS